MDAPYLFYPGGIELDAVGAGVVFGRQQEAEGSHSNGGAREVQCRYDRDCVERDCIPPFKEFVKARDGAELLAVASRRDCGFDHVCAEGSCQGCLRITDGPWKGALVAAHCVKFD